MKQVGLAAVVLVGCLTACGGKTETKSSASGAQAQGSAPASSSASGARFQKVKQPRVSAMCEQARAAFGYGAECVETELPELASAAGKIFRVVRAKDPTVKWRYALVRPSGEIFVADGGGNGDILKEVLKGLDAPNTPPELLAQLHAALSTEASVARCLPGKSDALPDHDGKPVPCAPPSITKDGADTILSYIAEDFPHPKLLNRDKHQLWARKLKVREHDLDWHSGSGAGDLPAATSLPPSAPPVPTMTDAPSWVAAPTEAPADVSAALCAKAVESVSGMEGQKCKAFAYPSLTLPTGSLYYLANDAGQAHLYGLKKPDGTLVVGYDLETKENPIVPLVEAYDPAKVPPATFIAAFLFLHGEADRILCLPGSNDVIPGAQCEPPAIRKAPDGGLVLTFIAEELPFANGNGMIPEPAVRSYSTEMSKGGGSLGGGTRLVDMRE